MAALLQANKPEYGLLDRTTYRQQAMVLQKGRLLVSQGCCDILSFLLRKNDAIELLVDDMVLED